ncbi:glycosyltransferase [Candidatus Parcubacteria bacterium]|nr:MAG: glycosyltransferase [Candidatus Parcubacteria bacterium]
MKKVHCSPIQPGKIIGLPVVGGNLEDISSQIIWLAKQSQKGFVCVANVHMLVEARKDMRLRKVLDQAGLVTSDGMPLVWALKIQGNKHAKRVAGPDLVLELCKKAQKENIPVYFFGSSRETINALEVAIGMRFPNLLVVGYESPSELPQCPRVDFDVLARLRRSGAKIIFVGLGCPKQEYWMYAYSPYLSAQLVGVGAAFDFIAGTLKRAPLWMQKSGLEWFYRLCSEPRRLWRRYLTTNSLFIWYYLIERLGLKK